MTTLFNDSEVFQKERPITPTAQQEADFYSKMAKELKQEGFSDSDEADIIADLKSLYPFTWNGYEMAKKLEHFMADAQYEITTRFCEWLEGLSHEYDEIKRNNVKAWVQAHNPKPKFEKGTKLMINARLCYGMEAGKAVYVTGGTPEEAVYWVDENPDRNGGTVLPYEKVEACCSPA